MGAKISLDLSTLVSILIIGGGVYLLKDGVNNPELGNQEVIVYQQLATRKNDKETCFKD